MRFLQNVNLASYTTMRLGGAAKWFVTVRSKRELMQAVTFAERHQLGFCVLGGGSNVISSGDFDGLIIIDRLSGFAVIAEDDESMTIRVAAGEWWDAVVAKTVGMGLSGIEKLSFIPGTAGATPVQNVGAYGAELADVFVALEAFDVHDKRSVVLDKVACHFGYRTSVFKAAGKRRYVITSITLQLSKQNPRPPFYASLQKYLDGKQIRDYSPQVIRDAVIAIRGRILPDPQVIPNAGSFFKNPFVSQNKCNELLKNFTGMPYWLVESGQVKLAAGWLIDQAGLKGYRAYGMQVYPENALVLVNEHAQNYSDLAAFRDEVVAKVGEKFGVTLEQEPETI